MDVASDTQLQLHILRAPMCKDRDGGDWDLTTISWLCLSGVMFKHPQSQCCYLHTDYKKKSVIRQRCLLPNMVLAAKLLRHSAISNQCKKVWGGLPRTQSLFPALPTHLALICSVRMWWMSEPQVILISAHMAPAAEERKTNKERMLQKGKLVSKLEEQTDLLSPRFHVRTIRDSASAAWKILSKICCSHNHSRL